MMLKVSTACISLSILGAAAIAQPTQSNLWPMDVGRVWEFDARVEGSVRGVSTGIYSQTIDQQLQSTSGRTIACFSLNSTVSPPGSSKGRDPYGLSQADLEALLLGKRVEGTGYVPSALLAVTECAFPVGLAAEENVALGHWSDLSGQWEWWWAGSDLSPGASFNLQIRTPIADDSFIGGTIRTDSGSVTTPAGTFENLLIVDYVLEWGESDIIEAGVGVIGTVTRETTGWIAFLPGTGPVASEETNTAVEFDCATCPSAIAETVTTTLELRSSSPVATERSSFAALKARY